MFHRHQQQQQVATNMTQRKARSLMANLNQFYGFLLIICFVCYARAGRQQHQKNIKVPPPSPAIVPAVPVDKPLHKNALIIVGPSASGKTTLTQRLLAELGPHQARKLVRHTTRMPRPNEVNNTDYTFASRQYMHKGVANGEFIIITELCDNIYGISEHGLRTCLQIAPATKPLRGDGQTGICISEMMASAMVLDALHLVSDMNSVVVFIRLPNITSLEQRMRGRSTETNNTMAARIHHAHDDMLFCHRKRHMVDYCLNNIDFETTYRRLTEIIRAEFGIIVSPQPHQLRITSESKPEVVIVKKKTKTSSKSATTSTATVTSSNHLKNLSTTSDAVPDTLAVRPTPVQRAVIAETQSSFKIKAIHNVDLFAFEL